MNRHTVIRFIVAHYDGTEEENRKALLVCWRNTFNKYTLKSLLWKMMFLSMGVMLWYWFTKSRAFFNTIVLLALRSGINYLKIHKGGCFFVVDVLYNWKVFMCCVMNYILLPTHWFFSNAFRHTFAYSARFWLDLVASISGYFGILFCGP